MHSTMGLRHWHRFMMIDFSEPSCTTSGWRCCPLRLVIEVDLLLRNDFQHDITHDVHHLGGVSMHRHMGGGRGDREDRCG